MRGFLTAYWQVEGGIGEDPATAALFAALPAGGGVALLPTERYREVVAVKRPESEGTARAGRPEPSGL